MALSMSEFSAQSLGEMPGQESDLDILVDVAPVHSPFFPGGLSADLEELLGRKVDILTPGGLHWYIRDSVLKEAVPL